jgi:DNA-binding NtrC family response regulator
MARINQFKKPRLLLVEPDEMIRNVLVSAFEKFGYAIIAVDTAEEGFRILHEDGLDVIISDYDLNGTNGLKFFESLKNVCPNKTKVLMITYGDVENVSETAFYGIHHVVEKPFAFEEFLSIIGDTQENRLAA